MQKKLKESIERAKKSPKPKESTKYTIMRDGELIDVNFKIKVDK